EFFSLAIGQHHFLKEFTRWCKDCVLCFWRLFHIDSSFSILLFLTGHITGKLLIDIGSGPTLHNALIASEYFQEIIMSDYVECNRKEIEKWLRRESGAHDWSHSEIVSFYRSTIEEREEKTRSVIKQVLKCDVTQINPFHPIVWSLQTADISVMHLGNATLLKPGGTLIIIGMLKETFYTLGKYKYSCLYIDQNFVKSALQKQGFVIQKFEAKPGPDKATNIMSDFERKYLFLWHRKQVDLLYICVPVRLTGGRMKRPSVPNN
uniref:Zgc:64002 n=1 Tax=Erpetoichthys calabaricus TaxID=27687 RepID=A0A8C4XDQ8_ERPCA